MLKLETQFSQTSVRFTGNDYAIYLLVKILPDVTTLSNTLPSRLPLNLALLLDNSGSMYGPDKRIYLAVEAAIEAVKLLQPQDIVSVISFSDRGMVLQNAAPATNQEQIIEAIKGIVHTPSGGTNISSGMRAAYGELHRYLDRQRNNRALLLTDGNTAEAHLCPQLAELEARNGIAVSTFGLGDDWNENLLRSISNHSGGNWYYIPQATDINAIFQEELGSMLASAYNNVRLNIKFFQPDQLNEVKVVSPEVKDLFFTEAGETKLKEIPVGTMQTDVPVFLLLTLTLLTRQPGQYNVASAYLSYDLPGQPGIVTDPHNLLIQYVSDSQMVYNNSNVLRWVDDAYLDKMVRTATELAAKGDKKRATQLFDNARSLSDRRGDSHKTRLIEEAMLELGNNGAISRKTQLKAINEARKTRFMPDE